MAPSKKNGSRSTTYVFIDESGFSEGSVIRRTWAPRGQTPVVRSKLRSWKRASAIGALAYQPSGQAKVLLRIHDGEIRAPQVLAFLRHLLRHIPGRVAVLWDGLQAHRSKLVVEWSKRQRRLTLIRLPAYAPELNPVEGLWSWIKSTCLANVAEDTLAPVKRRVRNGARRVRRRPAVLWGFLDKAELSL